MIIRPILDPRIVIRIGWKRMPALLITAVSVVLLNRYFGFDHVKIDTLPVTVLGTDLSILTADSAHQWFFVLDIPPQL